MVLENKYFPMEMSIKANILKVTHMVKAFIHGKII
jgi:hypothetical protein